MMMANTRSAFAESIKYATLCNCAFGRAMNAKDSTTMKRCMALHKKYQHRFQQAAARELKAAKLRDMQA